MIGVFTIQPIQTERPEVSVTHNRLVYPRLNVNTRGIRIVVGASGNHNPPSVDLDARRGDVIPASVTAEPFAELGWATLGSFLAVIILECVRADQSQLG